MREFFEDNTGRLSMTRLNSFILVISGIGYLFLTGNLTEAVALIGIATGSKGWQQVIEKKDKAK